MKSHHGEELPSFDCPDPRCDVTCTTKFNLVAHVQRAHPRRKNFTAEKAEKQYKPIKSTSFFSYLIKYLIRISYSFLESEKKEPKRKVNRTVVYCPLCPSIITGRCWLIFAKETMLSSPDKENYSQESSFHRRFLTVLRSIKIVLKICYS